MQEGGWIGTGSGGGIWEAGDVATKDRMNQKTIVVDTGASIEALATTYAGQLAFPTSNGAALTADVLYKRNKDNTEWNPVGLVAPDWLAYPHSTTIGDYSTPTGAIPFTDFYDNFAGYADVTAGDAAWPTTDAADMRVNPTNDNIDARFETDNTGDVIYHDLGAGNVSDTAWVLRFKFTVSSKSTACYLFIGLSSNTSADNVAQDAIGWYLQHEAVNKRSSAVDNDGAVINFPSPDDFEVLDPALATPYYVEIVRSSATAYTIKVFSDAAYSSAVHPTLTGACAATVAGLRYIKICNRKVSSAGTIVATVDDVQFWNAVTSAPSGSNANDDNTGTTLTSPSAVNPWLVAELSASVDKEPAAVAVHPNASTTVTQIKIQTSTDLANWTDKRLIDVADMTLGAWNYIRFNRDTTQVRYVRIYGTDGTAKVLAINEIKALLPTESQWNRRHGHKFIDPANASVSLVG